MDYTNHNIKRFPSITTFPVGRVRGIDQHVVVCSIPGRVGIYWVNQSAERADAELLAPFGIASAAIANPGRGWKDTLFTVALIEAKGEAFTIEERGWLVATAIAARLRRPAPRGLFVSVDTIVERTYSELCARPNLCPKGAGGVRR